MCSYNLDKRKQKSMENIEKCYKVVQQSRTGISAINVAKKINKDRTTVHNYLNTLELMEKVRSQHGLWFPKVSTQEQEKESISPKILSNFPFSTKEEREILNLLEKEGSVLFREELRAALQQKGFSESQFNDSLNGMVEKGWIFGIPRQGRIGYRINDFPWKNQVLIAALRSMEKYDPAAKILTQKYTENLSLHYGKLPDENIFKLAVLELAVEIKANRDSQDLIQILTNTPTQAHVLKDLLEKLKQ